MVTGVKGLLTRVGKSILLACLHGALGFCKLGGGNHFHRLQSVFSWVSNREVAFLSYLCDFLDVSHRLETQLNLAEGGHVASICRSSDQCGLLRDTGESSTGKHGEIERNGQQTDK